MLILAAIGVFVLLSLLEPKMYDQEHQGQGCGISLVLFIIVIGIAYLVLVGTLE